MSLSFCSGQPTPYWIGLNDRSEGKGIRGIIKLQIYVNVYIVYLVNVKNNTFANTNIWKIK